jgi:hypothetical protein
MSSTTSSTTATSAGSLSSHARKSRGHQAGLLGQARIFLMGFGVAMVLVQFMQQDLQHDRMSSLIKQIEKRSCEFDFPRHGRRDNAAAAPTGGYMVSPLQDASHYELSEDHIRSTILVTEKGGEEAGKLGRAGAGDSKRAVNEGNPNQSPTKDANRIKSFSPKTKHDHENSVTKQREVRKVTTVFSTSCSPFQDWQSQALVHNHQKMGIPGDLVRLMSCDDPSYQVPQLNSSRYPHYRVVRTPDFNNLLVNQGHVDYSPRNRPISMEYWLSGQSQDNHSHTPIGHEHIVVAVDPDHLFLDSGTWSLDNVKKGHGVAALYSMGDSWMDEWGPKLCSPSTKCNDWREKGVNPEFGHPIIFTAQDALTHAKEWINMTNAIKQLGHQRWESEMFTAVLAAVYTDIKVKVQPFMLSNREVNSEPWNRLLWKKGGKKSSSLLLPDRKPENQFPMLIGHYCQKYIVSSSYSFFKHELRQLDIRECSNGGDKNTPFKMPSQEDQLVMEPLRHKSLNVQSKMTSDQKEEIEKSRDIWMIDHVVAPILEALQVYFQDNC